MAVGEVDDAAIGDRIGDAEARTEGHFGRGILVPESLAFSHSILDQLRLGGVRRIVLVLVVGIEGIVDIGIHGIGQHLAARIEIVEAQAEIDNHIVEFHFVLGIERELDRLLRVAVVIRRSAVGDGGAERHNLLVALLRRDDIEFIKGQVVEAALKTGLDLMVLGDLTGNIELGDIIGGVALEMLQLRAGIGKAPVGGRCQRVAMNIALGILADAIADRGGPVFGEGGVGDIGDRVVGIFVEIVLIVGRRVGILDLVKGAHADGVGEGQRIVEGVFKAPVVRIGIVFVIAVIPPEVVLVAHQGIGQLHVAAEPVGQFALTGEFGEGIHRDQLAVSLEPLRREPALAVEIAVIAEIAAGDEEGQLVLEQRAAEASLHIVDRVEAAQGIGLAVAALLGRTDGRNLIRVGLQHPVGVIVVAEVIADIAGELAVQLFSAFLGDDIDHGRHRLAVFGIEGAADDLQFLDRRVLDLHAHIAGVAVGGGDAVNPVGDFAGAAAADVNTTHAVAHQTGLQFEHIGHFLDRHGGDLIGADRGHRGGLVFLHDGTVGNNRHLLADIDHGLAEADVDGGGHVDRDLDVGDGFGLIADHFDLHGVGARGDVDDHQIAIIVGDRAEHGAFQHHIDAGQGLAGPVVLHLADDLAGGAGKGQKGKKQSKDREPGQGSLQRLVHHGFPLQLIRDSGFHACCCTVSDSVRT